MIYLNEWDSFPAQWLRNLYPNAIVDETSIVALNRPPEEYGPYPWGVPVDCDLSQYRQVHFFAGIGGWCEALRLAGWPEGKEIWSGSCPCQPFSSAGDQRGFDDDRDLWPHMFRQIKRFRPAFVVGEQVANGRLPLEWLDRVFSDLESAGYTCWACDLPAASIGAPIIRQRLFWGAVLEESGDGAAPDGRITVSGCGSVVQPDCLQLPEIPPAGELPLLQQCAGDHVRADRPLGGSEHCRCSGRDSEWSRPAADLPSSQAGSGPQHSTLNAQPEFWDRYDTIHFTDGKVRRIEPALEPLAYGLPAGNAWALPRLRELGIDADAAKRIVALARSNRVGALRGFGNAIVPQVAAAFLRVWMDVLWGDER